MPRAPARYPGAVRVRARDLFFAEYSLPDVARKTQVSLATLKRWCRDGRWVVKRKMVGRMEDAAADLALKLTEAAAEVGDPHARAQVAFAAEKAAGMSGLTNRPPAAATPEQVARALLEELGEDEVIGPVLRRRMKARPDLARVIARRVERMEADS